MYSNLVSSVVVGIDARSVEIQCDVTGGLPAFQVVGLPEKEVSESRERVRSAIKNSGFSFPARRITANLAPADLRKEGVGFDLPIALAILLSSQQIVSTERRYVIVGELSLNGEVRPVPGVLAISMMSSNSKYDGLVVPEGNATEAALVDGLPVYPVKSLAQAAAFIAGLAPILPSVVDKQALFQRGRTAVKLDLSDVKGQEIAKRALEIAAAGGHNLMMSGPPGAGKSMLAHCLPGILPVLSFEEALEVTRVYSIAGLLAPETPIITLPPFRAPHHTISYAGMVGGGHGLPGPGEITLAHHGVLFLDEIPEFERHVLETLRQPLEDRSILLSRAGVSIRYPASFTMIGAMNPCPCGHLGDHTQPCTCTISEIKRYRRRLSGPFLDRVDLFVEVPRLTTEELLARPQGESSLMAQERVMRARRIQLSRFRDKKGTFTNTQLSTKAIETYCALDNEGKDLIKLAIRRLGLSARAYTRTLKVARTIADLDNSEAIRSAHLAEAIQYRASDSSL
jgi:magnesium chelatase family protein